MTDYSTTKNRMEPGGDKWVVAGELEIVEGATVTGLTGQTTFATATEAKAGTVTNKVISPATMKAAIEDKLASLPWDAAFVIGAEADNKVNIGIQLKDVAGVDLAVRGNVKAYLSDDANGDSVAATAPSGDVAIGTDGLAVPLVAGKYLALTSESDGDIDLDVTEETAKTFYLVLVMPMGNLVVSDAITFGV